MFQSERFFREAWPTISQAVESPADAARAVQWILGRTGLTRGTAVLDAPCGFGRHSVEFARRGYHVTGVDFNETEVERALKPGGLFVLDTRNRDHSVRAMPPEERLPVDDGTLRIENRFDATTSRWHARWWRLPHEAGDAATGELVGETEIRLYAAHELRAMLRPERWSQVDVYGALDGTPFSLDTPRLVFVARK